MRVGCQQQIDTAAAGSGALASLQTVESRMGGDQGR